MSIYIPFVPSHFKASQTLVPKLAVYKNHLGHRKHTFPALVLIYGIGNTKNRAWKYFQQVPLALLLQPIHRYVQNRFMVAPEGSLPKQSSKCLLVHADGNYSHPRTPSDQAIRYRTFQVLMMLYLMTVY